MVVVCDTCALLMLLRIAPDMFEDPRYGCVTIHNVWEEFTRSARIGQKYPWRAELRGRVKSIPQGELETAAFMGQTRLVAFLAQDELNARTGRPFHLSRTDQRVAATSLANDWEVCTVEYELEDFMRQHFGSVVVFPLRLVNNWLEQGLIEWDPDGQAVVEEWSRLHERPQLQHEIRRFEKLTGTTYPE